jgi:mRNA interferase RelE/StbE
LTSSKTKRSSAQKPSSPKPANEITKAQSPKWLLRFQTEAWEEWRALDGAPKQELKALLIKRLDQPRVPGGALHGDLAGCYKIKLRKHGYRLVYEVLDDVIVVLVLSVDKREDNAAYESAISRLVGSSRKNLIDGLRQKFTPPKKIKKA